MLLLKLSSAVAEAEHGCRRSWAWLLHKLSRAAAEAEQDYCKG
jgi:hypothetical protein